MKFSFSSRLQQASISPELLPARHSSGHRKRILGWSSGLFTLLLMITTAILFAQSTSLPIIGISRHALTNNGRIEGSAQQFLGESNNINSSANFFGDFFVPGTPNVNVNGAPVWNGQQVGGGSVNPSGYSINVNSGAHLDHLVTRTDPGTLATIAAPPNPSGSRNINIDNPSQAANVGDWATVRDVNLNSNAGNVAVPPGTYGNFTASNSNGSGFVFGVAGSTTLAVYNLQQLTLNSNSRLTLVGPVIITVKNQVAVNSNTAILGSSDNQNWLQLYSSNGGFSINSGAIIYGEVKAPSGHINLNGTIVGTAAADYLTVNSTGVLKPGVTNRAPLAQDDSYSTDEDITLTVNAPGVLGNDSDSDGDTLSAVKVTDPAHGNLTFNANGSFTYVPAANYHGTDSFTYKAGDGTLFSDVVTVHITINAVNDAPVAQDGTLTTDEDAPKAGQLHATDIDGDALTYSIVTPPQHGTVQLQQNGAYTYTPEADYNGADSFIFKVNDGQADSNHATIAITINPLNDAPVAVDDSYTTPKNTALTVAAPGLLANDSDVDDDALAAAVETQPAHGTLTLNADGGLTYAPQAGYVGDDSFTYRASDGTLQSNIATVTISVTFVNTPPTAQDGNVTTDEDTAVAVTLQGDDADGDTLIYTIVTPPQHGTLSGTAPDLTYTPDANYSGADSFTFKTNDGTADSNIATIAIIITPVNDAPVAQESTFTLAEDTELQAQTTASDADGDALTYQLVTDTQYGTLIFNNDGSFTYTPQANYNGADSFTFKANDGTTDSNIATVHLTITPVNDAPVAQDDSYSTLEDVPLIIPAPGVLDNDTDIDGDALTTVVETAPAHGTLTLNDDGSFTYIPDADYNGPDSFTYRASDGTLQSNIATVALTITPVNDAPLAQNGAWAIDEDTFLQNVVQATDADGDALTFVATTQPQHGTLIFNSDGTFTYTPNADYSGTDSFLFTANDGQVDSNPAVVTITVRPINDVPVARDDVYQMAERQILRVSAPGVLANDTDPDNDPLTASVLLQPAHGTLTFHADGSFIYEPQNDYTGPDSFTYEIDDGHGGQARARVQLVVTPVNEAPHAVDDTAESPGTALDIAVLANDTDPDGDPLTVVSVEPGSDEAEVSINPDGTVRYVPSPGFDGTFTFTYVISDPGGLQSAATVTVTMAQPAPIDTRGTEFWLAFPGNLVDERWLFGTPRLVLSISAQTAATGQIEVPAISFQQSFSLAAGQNVDIELPDDIQIDSNDAVENLAIHVTSDNPISVYGVNFATALTEGYLGLPVRSLGTEYIILSYTAYFDNGNGVNIPSQLSLVGVVDGTEVTITPTVTGLNGRQANVPYTITLNQGQTYQLRSMGDLTGSVVTSTKPVSAYGGNACTDVPAHVAACNQLVEQLLPTNAWGSEFFTMPLATRYNGDTFRFLAQTDGTTVSVNGMVVATLNRGEYHEQIINGPAQITSSHPITAAQYSNGTLYDGVVSDPFMMLAPSTSQYASRYTLTTPQSGITYNYVNLIVPSASTGNIRMDGEEVAASSFTAIGDGSYSGVQIPISIGSHTFVSTDNAEFGIFLYGFDASDGYGYPGALGKSSDLPPDTTPPDTDPPGPDTTPPVVHFTSAEDGSYQDSLSWISGDASDNTDGQGLQDVTLSVERQSDGKYWTGTEWGDETQLNVVRVGDHWWKFDGLPQGDDLLDGDYVLTVTATDKAGNSTVEQITVHVDAHSPLLAFTAPTDKAVIPGLPQVTGTASDAGSGVAQVDLWIQDQLGRFWDGTSWQDEESSLSTTLDDGVWSRTDGLPSGSDLPDGLYYLYAQATDGAGHTAGVSIMVRVQNLLPGSAQADALIRNATDSADIGNDIYNTTGENQTAQQTAAAGSPAQYLITAQNDGTTPQKLAVQAPDAAAQWTVHYFDDDNNDITSTILAGNWQTPLLNPGQSATIRLTVEPDDSLPGESTFTLDVAVDSTLDGSRDVVRAITTKEADPPPAPAQPDGWISTDGMTFLGDDVYNTSGTDQTAQLAIDGGTTATYHLKLQNDSASPDRLVLFSGDSTTWDTTFFDSDNNDITEAVKSTSGWATPELAAGASASVRVEVFAATSIAPGSSLNMSLGIVSQRDPSSLDILRAITSITVPPPPTWQADALIRGIDDSTDIGDDIYNITGENQAAQQTASTEEPAQYLITAQNDGSAPQALVIHGPVAAAPWDVRYYDGANTDITDVVKSTSGWQTPQLLPGAKAVIRLEVTPDSGLLGESTLTLGVAVDSPQDGSRDVVLAVTQKEAEPPQAAARPDGQINGGTSYVGDNVYNANGIDQTASQEVDAGTTATYHVKLQNDSTDPDQLLLLAGDSPYVEYFDSNNTDITAAVTDPDNGWMTPQLASGASAEVRVEVTPPVSATPGSTFNLLLAIYSQRDPALLDMVKAVTTVKQPPPPTWQVDGLIRGFTDAAEMGDNVYNITGENQTSQQTATSDTPASFFIKAQNDGSAPQQLAITGATDMPWWYIRYVDSNEVDITGSIAAGGWLTPTLLPGESAIIRLDVMPEEGLPNGSSFRLPVSVTSTQDGSVDIVLAWTAVSAFPGSSSSQAPDLVIGDEDSEAGDGIYNSTGEDQTFAKSVQAGETAYYDIALQNDSDIAQKFVLTLPAPAGNGWEVRLIDADGGDVDITDDARDIAGAVSPEMQPGEEYLLYVAVTPDVSVADNAVQESLLVATTEDGNEQDAVKMETTRLPKSGDTDPTDPPDPTKVLPAPVISPAGGTYTGMVKVNITPGAQSPSATIIYYSLDGSEPGPGNPASRASSGTLLLVQNATVKAKAYAIGFNPSPAASESYTITHEPGSGAPGVNIATPADGAEITAPTAVTGDVNSDNLAYWELGVRPMAANQSTDGSWQRIAWGETTVSNGQLGTLDPTLLLNGLYEVRLIAYDRAGQSVEDFVHVVIKGGMKIGNFTLSFTDMVLPVAGMPLAVTRTYDSRDKRVGDFGVGWTLGVSDVRIQKNGSVGGSDQMQIWNSHKVPGGGLFGTYVIDAVKPRIVTITLPDGTVYSFRAKVQPEQQSLQLITYGTIAWTPQPGTKGTLQIVGDNSFFADTTGPVTLTDDFGNPVDYHEFILTLPDGRQFYVEEGKGIHWMRDRGGNRIDLLRDGSGRIMQLSSTPAGSSSPARSVFFTRNSNGQITSISDAKGAKVLYQQDEYNDLVKVTDRTDNVTRFVYDPLHNIVDIRDPRGVQAVRNEYNDDGRLIATVDAKGNLIEFDHDIDGRAETILDRKGRQSVLHYDDYGNVTSTTRFLDGRAITTSSEYGDPNNPDKPTKTTDALGNSTSFVYNANGSPTQITDPLGHTTQMTYDDMQVKTVIDAAGIVVVDNTYNAQGQLTSSKDALGNTTLYEYFPSGAPKRVTDAKGKSTLYALDSNYNIASVTDAKGHIVAFDYDANGNKIKQTTNRTAPDGSLQTLITSYKYDGNGRLIQTTRPDGSNSYTTYNSIGKVEYTRDALFRVTSFTYDELGQKIGTTYPDGTVSETSYDENGNVLASKDRAGRVTNYVYDELDRQVKTILPDGNFTRQVYDDAGRVVGSYDEKNHKISYEYDDAGRQVKTTDALGHETVTTYDSRDRQSSVKDALNKVTSFTYDDAGKVLSTTFADNTSTSTVYDELGRAIQQTDQAGRVTKFAFDELGRLIGVAQVMDPSDSTKDLITTYAYDEVGNKILQTDAKGNRTEFAYDNMGRITGRKLPGGQVEAMLYNSIGQLTAKTDFAGKTTSYSYDQRGRLIQKKPDPTLGEATVSFSYPNELTKISTRGSIQNIYKYDAERGWLNSVQTINGKIDYGYDAAGNRTAVKITGKDGGIRETDYAYDSLNRVSSVSRVGVGTLANYSYTAVGNVAGVTRANGVTSSYGYDDLHRLTAIQHKKGTEVLSQFNYALNADGKRNTLQEYLKYPTSQPVSSVNRTVFYGYDAAGRLNAEQRQSTSTLTVGGTVANTARTIWTYDKVGNRLTQAVSNYDGIGIAAPSVLKSTFNTSYSYNNNDWLTSTTSVRNDESGESTFVTNFEYNANGSQKAVISNVGKPEEKTTPYFYDFEQKLTRIGNPTDTVKHAYAYDADGNRIAESNTGAGGTNVRNYLVDPNNSNAQVVEEYNNANALLAHYDWNDDELLRIAAFDETTSTYDIREPLADGHNNIRQLLDSTASISDIYTFDAWGNQQENIGGSFNPYRYNSQRLDASGLYYLRARQYSSGMGRFLTHDPIMGGSGSPITQHRYLYAGDDAVNAMDPSGEFLTGIAISPGIMETRIAQAAQAQIAEQFITSTVGKIFASATAALVLMPVAAVTSVMTYDALKALATEPVLVPDYNPQPPNLPDIKTKQEPEPEPEAVFVHGTSSLSLDSFATGIEPIGGGDFGAGFYTFYAQGPDGQRGIATARRRARSIAKDKGGSPMLIFVKIKQSELSSLSALQVTPGALWDNMMSRMRSDRNFTTGYDLVYGPVGQRYQPSPDFPLQFKFETSNAISKLRLFRTAPA